jgi:pectin methylesterase-like acyl-CoA thioesterase
VASIPVENSDIVSANGKIVLTFSENVKAGLNGGILELNGNSLTPIFRGKEAIYSYNNLEYGTLYELMVPSGSIVAERGGAYDGTTISFTTLVRTQPEPRLYDAVVDINGTGDYTRISDAIRDIPGTNRDQPWLIFIKNGRYDELIRIPRYKSFVHLIGQDKDSVILTFKINCSSLSNPNDIGKEYSKEVYKQADCAATVIDAPNFYAENISFENAWGVEAQSGPQALAIKTYGDKMAFYNCKLRSFQDTWQTSVDKVNDRAYAHQCWIEGAVDYIYGGGNALIEECTLYNVRSGSVIVAPNHNGVRYGYVFNNCTIDGNNAAADGKQKLGRPWHHQPVAVYLNSTVKIPIHPEGWTDMGPAAKLFAEYNSMDINGDTIDLRERRTWYKQNESYGGQTVTGLKAVLSQEEALKYTYENVVMSYDRWNPRAFFERVDSPQNLQATSAAELSWEPSDYAICYIIYRDNKVVGFTKETVFTDTLGLELVGSPTCEYRVQGVNEYGGLGIMSAPSIVKLATSVSSVVKIGDPVVIRSGDELVVKNIEPDSEVTLYDIQGRVVYQRKSGSDILSIPVKGLKGFYFVKIGVEYILKIAL